jgi:glycosyltransferase involved in cell wall biosynthesis
MEMSYMSELQPPEQKVKMAIASSRQGIDAEPPPEVTIAVVIPAYNEEATLANVLQDFLRELPDAELIVVDNNSTDNTRNIAEETLKRLKCIGHVIQELERGKGNTIRRAFSEVDADIIVMVDADSTYMASDVHRLIGPVRKGEADMVVGDRHTEGQYQRENKRAFHNFGNTLVRWIINRLFRANLNDVLSGFRAFSRKFVENFPIMSTGFELEIEMTLHALDKKFRVKELPIAYHDRPEGSTSKLKTFSDGLRVILTILHIFRYYRPVAFFGSLAAQLALAGLMVGVRPIVEYAMYRYIYAIPSAVLATGLMIFSVICFSLGIVLDTIVKLHNFDFLLRMNDRTMRWK